MGPYRRKFSPYDSHEKIWGEHGTEERVTSGDGGEWSKPPVVLKIDPGSKTTGLALAPLARLEGTH
jgi:hypothetical protein